MKQESTDIVACPSTEPPDYVGPRGVGTIDTGEFNSVGGKLVWVGQRRTDSFCDTGVPNIRENPPEGEFYEVVGQKPVPLDERIARVQARITLGEFVGERVKNRNQRRREALALLG